MAKVWKYPVRPTKAESLEFSLDLPADARILHFAMQYDQMFMWALIPTHPGPTVSRRFRLAGTGHDEIYDASIYIGTVQLRGGALVLHLFEESH